MRNLDLIAAEAAQAIIAETKGQKPGEVENLITKALGILQENGVYAALLYLYSRTTAIDKAIATKTRGQLLSLLAQLALPKPADMSAATILKFLTENICNDLDRVLLVKQIWEQALIYARYGAKARSAAEDVKL